MWIKEVLIELQTVTRRSCGSFLGYERYDSGRIADQDNKNCTSTLQWIHWSGSKWNQCRKWFDIYKHCQRVRVYLVVW